MDASNYLFQNPTAAHLAALAPFERMALVVLAASSTPYNRSEWMRRLRDLDVLRPSSASPGKTSRPKASEVSISTGDLSALIDRTRPHGLIVESPPDSQTYICPAAARHLLLDAAEARDLLERMRAALRRPDQPRFVSFDTPSKLQAARLALYCRDPAEASARFAELKPERHRVAFGAIYTALLEPKSPAAALQLLPTELRSEYATHVTSECLSALCLPAPDMLAAIAQAATDPEARARAAMLAALSGDPGPAESWLGADAGAQSLEARAVLALQRGAVTEARALTIQAWNASRDKRKKCRLSSRLAPLLTLLLATGEPEHAALARAQVELVMQKGRLPLGYMAVAQFLKIPGIAPRPGQPMDLSHDLEVLCVALVSLYNGDALDASFIRDLKARCGRYRTLGARWLVAEVESALARAGVELAPTTPPQRGFLADLRQAEPPWERTLSVLEALAPAEAPALPAARSTATADRRLVFLVRILSREVTTEEQRAREQPVSESPAGPMSAASESDRVLENTLQVEPRLQTRRGSGYTTGRAVALKTLFEGGADMDYVTPEDRRVVATIQSIKRYWGGRDFYFGPRVALALVGHPCVFWENDPEGPAVQVIKQAPRLRARRGEHGFYLRVEPFANAAGIGVLKDDEGRLVVCEQSLPQQNVQRAVVELPPVPADGEARLRQVLGRLSTLFTVESHVGVDAVEKVAADARIVLQLARAEPGLRVRIGVAPLGVRGPRFMPGHGPATVAAEIERKRVSCVRDLSAEQHALAALVEAVPALGDASEHNTLRLESLTQCLQLLQALSSQADAIIVEWPEGAPLAVTSTLDVSSLRLTLGEETSWLTATGKLAVDEQRVLELMEVLARRTPDGAFIALDEDRFVALSAELQQGLSALEAATTNPTDAPDAALRVAPIALGFVSPWLKTLRAAGQLKATKRLNQQLSRIEQAYTASYVVPKTFQAELRPYQITGFEFLARLAEIGAGACLADDMGLGKTLMTLALLLARAADGPALIVAPTSVRANWFDEALRFAPALRMRRAEELQPAALDALEPFDVLVTSYTLMTQRVEQLERVRFAVLVLDEAQAIKNAATQRARAACRLVADARIALTGTPVENHLGDLFGIMSFLNPGLLGDAKYFEARFGRPIQREQDARARGQLRALIAPFVLRRRKSEVLRELPARTEITLRVEPDAQERAFTEALRRAALERLQSGASASSTVSILAEITRLRRAACHPRLVDASVDVGAAKLECLVELVHELRDGGHRALVFSQFVDFLKLVRTRLEAEGVSFQYLDGSTPEPARRKAVMDFQSGAGDVFLISLKAGGFGLNLTAADYVIHLDPWWNPAVEAQASDRAHRLGQQRPVTIYRLVNAASIEERVLSLHERKQSLAEEILSDSAELTKLDPEALLALLAE